MAAVMYGVEVTYNFYFQKSSFTWANSTPLPSIVVNFSKAVIDNCFLSWLDVNKLQAAFPNRVQILDDTVTLTGPVTIVSHNIGSFQRIYMQSSIAFVALLIAALITYIFISIFFPPSNHAGSRLNDQQITTRVIALAAVSLTAFVAAFYAAGRLIPTQAGVYFNKELPFYA